MKKIADNMTNGLCNDCYFKERCIKFAAKKEQLYCEVIGKDVIKRRIVEIIKRAYIRNRRDKKGTRDNKRTPFKTRGKKQHYGD